MVSWQIAVGSVIAGIAYRGGGKGGFKNAKAIRRFGCPLVAFILLFLQKGIQVNYWYIYLFAYILSYASMTTYHDYLAPDGTSEDWKCWLTTGFCYGMAFIPLAWIGFNWYAILTRSIILGLTVMFLRENTGNDVLEETGSGALYILTQPIMYI